jgi:hypothetical protein
LGKDNSSIVYELNRLIVNDGLKKNSLSYFVGGSLKLLPRPMCIVSYADTSFGHTGYIYQATNWLYTGLSAKRGEKYDPENPNRHSKSVIEKVGVVYNDLPSRPRPQKHRYVYFIGTKKEKSEMLKNLRYKILPYPKGDNTRYDSSYKPLTQMVIEL